MLVSTIVLSGDTRSPPTFCRATYHLPSDRRIRTVTTLLTASLLQPVLRLKATYAASPAYSFCSSDVPPCAAVPHGNPHAELNSWSHPFFESFCQSWSPSAFFCEKDGLLRRFAAVRSLKRCAPVTNLFFFLRHHCLANFEGTLFFSPPAD